MFRGLVALNDQTDPNVGGFQCIPELYREYENLETKSTGRTGTGSNLTPVDLNWQK